MSSCRGLDFENDDNVAWSYCPSFGAAIVFAVLFGVVSIVHLVQAVAYKKRFSWVIIVAGFWEVTAFSLRAAGAKDLFQKGVAIPSFILIALAPLWINAYVYMVLGRMVHFFLPDKQCFGISARKLTLIFVLLDVIAFLVQGSSSSLMTSDTPSTTRIGINIYMGGIGLQELFVLLFTALSIRFHKKMAIAEQIQAPLYPWRSLLYAVYAGLALISVRIIFRLIEYSGGIHSSLATNEAAFYVLDATTMLVAVVLFNIFHPGKYLVGPGSEFPKKEKKEKNKKSKKNKKGNKLEDVESQGEMDELRENKSHLRDGIRS
ncbi:hypothetical protein FQN57_002427 [Myotisia sp. PD_48]|nr:hypothetical protein FQN57_002427 [Myotisia sp. PD_48]